MQSTNPRRRFDPIAHDLNPNFRLTKLTELYGCGCKVPPAVVSKLLENIFTEPVSEDDPNDTTTFMFMDQPAVQRIGTAGVSDCSIIKLKQNNLCLVQTSDYIYPLVDDPYMMGMIACASVLGDLYATGAEEISSIQMLLGISNKITQKERDVIAPLIIRGFKDGAEAAGVYIKGGQTLVNPWMVIGGTATSIVQRNTLLIPQQAEVGDVLVLTKPLGTHIACIASQWMTHDKDKWSRIKQIVSEEEIEKAYQRALAVMSRLNKLATQWMKYFHARGATDVTGYGLLGAASSLAKAQQQDVTFVLHNLPVIAKMAAVNKVLGNAFNLTQGLAPETSGGLLIVFAREHGAAFAKKMEEMEGLQAWIVGVVQKGNKTARVIDKPRLIDVPMKERPDTLW